VNPTVGDLTGNAQIVQNAVAEAATERAHLVLLPEFVLNGYSVDDLALRPSFQQASREALAKLATALNEDGYGEMVVVVGHLDRLDDQEDRLGVPHGSPINAASVIHRGKVIARYAKHHLPNYGVFDEFRYFVPGDKPLTIRIHGVDVTLAICEDLWQDGGPETWAREANAGLLAVINGSPYEKNKDDVRLQLCANRAREAGCALAYVNMVGGQDELVFDGDSLVVNETGTLVARAPQFEEGVMIVDLDLKAATAAAESVVVVSSDPLPPYEPLVMGVAVRAPDAHEVYGALVCGLRDYVRKNGFRSVLLGLSGGIDSALVAAIAVDALGPDNVYAVSMPSHYSSEHSKSDAQDMAERTGIHLRTIEIAPMIQAYLQSTELTGLAEENLQARVRGTLLMGISNQEGHLVLATGNKSELAVGYSTIYGDAVGGYAPIKDLLKTEVWALSRWRNDAAEITGATPPIPPNSIEKPPSAELRPGQLDSDSLPDYEVLDAILDEYVEGDRGAQDLIAKGFDRDLVIKTLRMVDGAEYKRRQYPPGTKVSSKAFGRDRRLPITNRWREKG